MSKSRLYIVTDYLKFWSIQSISYKVDYIP